MVRTNLASSHRWCCHLQHVGEAFAVTSDSFVVVREGQFALLELFSENLSDKRLLFSLMSALAM